MERNRHSSFLFGRIFFDEPVSTSSENALAIVAAAPRMSLRAQPRVQDIKEPLGQVAAGASVAAHLNARVLASLAAMYGAVALWLTLS